MVIQNGCTWTAVKPPSPWKDLVEFKRRRGPAKICINIKDVVRTCEKVTCRGLEHDILSVFNLST